jgi:hypothetical protein
MQNFLKDLYLHRMDQSRDAYENDNSKEEAHTHLENELMIGMRV